MQLFNGLMTINNYFSFLYIVRGRAHIITREGWVVGRCIGFVTFSPCTKSRSCGPQFFRDFHVLPQVRNFGRAPQISAIFVSFRNFWPRRAIFRIFSAILPHILLDQCRMSTLTSVFQALNSPSTHRLKTCALMLWHICSRFLSPKLTNFRFMFDQLFYT